MSPPTRAPSHPDCATRSLSHSQRPKLLVQRLPSLMDELTLGTLVDRNWRVRGGRLRCFLAPAGAAPAAPGSAWRREHFGRDCLPICNPICCILCEPDPSAVLRIRLFQPPSGPLTADEDGERTDNFSKPAALRGLDIAFGLTFTNPSGVRSTPGTRPPEAAPQ